MGLNLATPAAPFMIVQFHLQISKIDFVQSIRTRNVSVASKDAGTGLTTATSPAASNRIVHGKLLGQTLLFAGHFLYCGKGSIVLVSPMCPLLVLVM
jgi:hypothetical protein